MKEGRYAMLAQSDPARAKQLLKAAQHDADARWQLYEQVAGVHRVVTPEHGTAASAAPAEALAAGGADPPTAEGDGEAATATRSEGATS